MELSMELIRENSKDERISHEAGEVRLKSNFLAILLITSKIESHDYSASPIYY